MVKLVEAVVGLACIGSIVLVAWYKRAEIKAWLKLNYPGLLQAFGVVDPPVAAAPAPAPEEPLGLSLAVTR